MFHHKLLRRLLALICALALCLGLSGPVSAAGDVYFSVVNDSMITLSDSTMPVWSGGVLYVPHSVFDGTNSTGIGFGLNFSYNRDTGIASLFTTQQILTFDLNRGISYDYISGTPLKGRAILRNGRPYLPVGQVCSFFGLSYSVIAIPEGHIVRVKNSAVSLSDVAFVDAASNLISRYLREYSQSQQSPPTPGIRPPTSSGTDAPLQEEPEDTGNTLVYLGFRCDDTQGLAQVLAALPHLRQRPQCGAAGRGRDRRRHPPASGERQPDLGADRLCPHHPCPGTRRPAKRPSGGGLGLLERDGKRRPRRQPDLSLHPRQCGDPQDRQPAEQRLFDFGRRHRLGPGPAHPAPAAGLPVLPHQRPTGDQTMRQIDLTHPNRVPGSEARVARLTRHLRARLLDFGPGGPEVLSADEAAGAVRARFPGHDAAKILDRLAASAGVRARLDGDCALFLLSPDTRFEDLDYLWGSLFDLLA